MMATVQIVRSMWRYVGIIENVSAAPQTVVHLMKCAEVSIRSSSALKIQKWYCCKKIEIDKEVQ